MNKPKDVDEYISMHQGAVSQNPECGNSHYNLAVGYVGQRRFEEAERELHAALECSPSLAEAYVLLGGICLNRGDLDGLSGVQPQGGSCEARLFGRLRQHRLCRTAARQRR